MNRIPCKKCPQCGLYNDFTIVECKCGKKLNNITAHFTDTEDIPPEQYGEIDTSLKVYVQKCSACGALNYTADPSNPVKVCCNCHKTRIATIVPAEYIDDQQQDAQLEEEAPVSDNRSYNAQNGENQLSRNQSIFSTGNDDDDDDDSIQWQGILGNIQKAVGTMPKNQEAATDSNPSPIKMSSSPQITGNFVDDDDDDDGDWSDILGTEPSQKMSTAPLKKNITLTAIRYGRLSFTVDAGEGSYMLGRSANQGSFLEQDGRVGNEHCYLLYRNGTWYVKDNNSRNGTAVNSRDIGLNGECMLSDGDELKLGHHPDSMAFRVAIR